MGINKDSWSKLDDKTKEIFIEKDKEWTMKTVEQGQIDLQNVLKKAPKEYGVKFIKPSDEFVQEFSAKCKKEIWPKWIEKGGDKEAQRIVNDFEKIKSEIE